MAAIYPSMKDGTQALFAKGSDVLRLVQVDEAGTVLTAAAADIFGNDGGSIIETPFKRTSKWEMEGSSTAVVGEAANFIGHTITTGVPTFSGEFIGDLNKFMALSTGTGKYILEELLLSGLNNIYFKAAYYEPVAIKTAAAPTTSTQYLKRIIWMCKFLPSVSKTFQADGLKIIPFTLLPEIKDSATDLGLNKGGKMWKTMLVNDIQAQASETFESQTEATT